MDGNSLTRGATPSAAAVDLSPRPSVRPTMPDDERRAALAAFCAGLAGSGVPVRAAALICEGEGAHGTIHWTPDGAAPGGGGRLPAAADALRRAPGPEACVGPGSGITVASSAGVNERLVVVPLFPPGLPPRMRIEVRIAGSHPESKAERTALGPLLERLLDRLTTATVGANLSWVADLLPWGVIGVGAEQQVTYMNRAAHRMVKEDHGLTVRGNRLRLHRSASDRTLAGLLDAALARSPASPEDPPTPGALLAPGPDGVSRYALVVVPGGASGAGPAGAVVLVGELTGRRPPSGAILADLFSLSNKEAALAEAFAAGLDLDSAARRMGISPNTARVHLHNIFAKTGTASQVELARMLARLPV